MQHTSQLGRPLCRGLGGSEQERGVPSRFSSRPTPARARGRETLLERFDAGCNVSLCRYGVRSRYLHAASYYLLAPPIHTCVPSNLLRASTPFYSAV